MATADKKSLFVNGGNGSQLASTGNPITDLERAQDVARRYRCEFVDLTDHVRKKLIGRERSSRLCRDGRRLWWRLWRWRSRAIRGGGRGDCGWGGARQA